MRIVKLKNNILVVLMLIAVFAVAISTTNAAVPIPSGFKQIASGKGVRIFQKNYSGGQPDYVLVVDLRDATLGNFTGNVSGTPYMSTVERRSLQSFYDFGYSWNTSNRKLIAAINGTFFVDKVNGRTVDPTGIAFGLKSDYWIISTGYGINEPGRKYTLLYDNAFGSASIPLYNRDIFFSGTPRAIPNVIGGLDVNYNKDGKMDSYIPRTFVGVRDDDRNGHSETVIFFASAAARQRDAVSVLNGFGAGSKMMLDGGGSTGLIVNGSPKISTSRTIPQAFVIFGGK